MDNQFFKFNQANNQESAKTVEVLRGELEGLIWKEIEEFGYEEIELTRESDQLFEVFKNEKLPYDIRFNNEKRYWEIQKKLAEIRTDQDELMLKLENLQNNSDVKKIKELIKEFKSESEEKISKRKAKILEERERLGDDHFDLRGTQIAHPTTGRHQTHIKSSKGLDSFSAVSEFNYHTTDTHGGKVDFGKSGHQYITKEGKRVRKK